MTHKEQRVVVVFDFDGTLTTKDTLLEFIKHTHGTFSLWFGMLLHAPLLVLMKLHMMHNGKVKEKVLSYFYKGLSYKIFQEYCKSFSLVGKDLIRTDILARLKKHQLEGAEVYVVTASIVDWVKPICEALAIEKVLGTELETDNDGKLTGKMSTPNCYGAEKVRRLLEVEPDRKSYILHAYGDSRGDKEMFAEADYHTLV